MYSIVGVDIVRPSNSDTDNSPDERMFVALDSEAQQRIASITAHMYASSPRNSWSLLRFEPELSHHGKSV